MVSVYLVQTYACCHVVQSTCFAVAMENINNFLMTNQHPTSLNILESLYIKIGKVFIDLQDRIIQLTKIVCINVQENGVFISRFYWN